MSEDELQGLEIEISRLTRPILLEYRDANDLLSYAKALRLTGRSDEARAVYQRLATSPLADIATAARQRLAELPQALPTPTVQPTRDASQAQTQSTDVSARTDIASAPTPQATPPPAPTAQPTPQSARQASPDERYRRGVELWGQNRGAALAEFRAAAGGGNLDAHYYVGLSYVEGKDLRTLSRTELVAALRNFQVAQRGSHGAQARRYVQQLEKEYDRIRNQQ